jgi:hypothetical protein
MLPKVVRGGKWAWAASLGQHQGAHNADAQHQGAHNADLDAAPAMSAQTQLPPRMCT